MSRAVEVKKPQEAQKAKALSKMKAAKEAGEEYNDPTCQDNILGRNQTRFALWEEHLKDPVVALDQSVEVRGEFVLEGLGPSAWWKECLALACAGFFQRLWEKPIWEGVWPFLDPMDGVCLRTASMEWNVPGKYGPHGELFFFPIQKEPATEPVGETFSPFFNADIRTHLFSANVLKKCAFVALHLIAEGGRDGDRCHVPGLGDE